MIKNLPVFVLCFGCFLVAKTGQGASPLASSSLTAPELGPVPANKPQPFKPQEQEQEQEPSPNSESKANKTAEPKSKTTAEPKSEQAAEPVAKPTSKEADDPRELLIVKLRDEYWEAKDKKGAKRKAEPALFDAHEQMTRQWVAKLSEEDLGALSAEDPPADLAKRVKELLRDYNKKSQEVATRLTMARRLAKKIMLAHWQSLAQTGVQPNNVPEYARDYEHAVEGWFLSRSIEDLKIFEKTRPSKSERERGDKITAELVEKIEEVKQKYEGNLR